jgi:hypothetical protein
MLTIRLNVQLWPSFANQLHHTPTTMQGKYGEIQGRIEQACEMLYECSNSNISSVAREFEVPRPRPQARWKGCQSKQQRPAANKEHTDSHKLAVSLYLDCLDAIGTSARYSMLIDCANSIFRRSRDPEPTDTGSTTPSLIVGEHWARRRSALTAGIFYASQARSIAH